jgi:hypothetical protein
MLRGTICDLDVMTKFSGTVKGEYGTDHELMLSPVSVVFEWSQIEP